MTSSGSKVAPLLDVVVLATGALAFVASLMPWYRGGFSVFGFSGSVGVNAWNAGAGAWMSVLLLVAAGAVVLVAGVGGPRASSAGAARLVFGLSVVAVVCLAARWASWPGSGDDVDSFGGVELSGSGLGGLVGASSGIGVGFYLGLLAAAMAVVASGLKGARRELTA